MAHNREPLKFRYLFHGTSTVCKEEIEMYGLVSKAGRLHLTTNPDVALLEAQRTVHGEEGFATAYKQPAGGSPMIVQVQRHAAKCLILDTEYYDKAQTTGRRLVPMRAAFVTDVQVGPEHLSFLEGKLELKCDELVQEILAMTRLSPLAPRRNIQS